MDATLILIRKSRAAMRLFFRIVLLLLLTFNISFTDETATGVFKSDECEIIFQNDIWAVQIIPGTMRISAVKKSAGNAASAKSFLLSSDAQTSQTAKIKKTDPKNANYPNIKNCAVWEFPEQKIEVSAELKGERLYIIVSSRDTMNEERDFRFPVIHRSDDAKAFIMPRAEGCYIPLDDEVWLDYLTSEREWNTTEGFCMPFWGFLFNDKTVTCIITNPFNNTVRFNKEAGSPFLDFSHEFTRLDKKRECGFIFILANPSSIEPAKQYRRYLLEGKNFVAMKDKLLCATKAERLLGAAHIYLWGDGVSSEMLRQFADSGLDRLRLCLSSWTQADEAPGVAEAADKSGFLFGTYDSYHSIHDPSLRGTDATWETAQFDKELYETGAIVDKEGNKLRGFNKKGYKLSPVAARPYVEKRVSEVMNRTPFNHWFIDCDAFGDVYDDYSPLHTISAGEDAAARISRLKWIVDTFQCVVGSEGGSAYAVPVIYIAEGIMTPVIGWGDPDLKDRKSKYFIGGYWPPTGPNIFLLPALLKDKYKYLYYAPQFRLPLYEIVFHDSVVATHHWTASSLKFKNVRSIVELTELLYMTPPLYHLNLAEFKKRKEFITQHYKFFSPIHRKLGFLQMTNFLYLNTERTLQMTEFADGSKMVANFTEEPLKYDKEVISGKTVRVFPGKNLEDGKLKTHIYTAAE